MKIPGEMITIDLPEFQISSPYACNQHGTSLKVTVLSFPAAPNSVGLSCIAY